MKCTLLIILLFISFSSCKEQNTYSYHSEKTWNDEKYPNGFPLEHCIEGVRVFVFSVEDEIGWIGWRADIYLLDDRGDLSYLHSNPNPDTCLLYVRELILRLK